MGNLDGKETNIDVESVGKQNARFNYKISVI